MTEKDNFSSENALKIIIPAEMIKDEGYGYPMEYKGKDYLSNWRIGEYEKYGLNPLNLYKVKEIK